MKRILLLTAALLVLAVSAHAEGNVDQARAGNAARAHRSGTVASAQPQPQAQQPQPGNITALPKWNRSRRIASWPPTAFTPACRS